MTSDKTEATTKNTTADKTPAAKKEAAKPVIKPAAKKAAAMPEQTAKKPDKAPKEKLAHGNFSMPESEFRKVAEIKEACLKAGLRVKKNEVLRAGLKALGAMNAPQLESLIAELGKVKTVRAKKP